MPTRICPTASVTISGLKRSTATRKPLNSPTRPATAEHLEDRGSELAVLATRESDEQVRDEDDDAGRREVDPARHDHERLSERRDRDEASSGA